MGVGSFPFLPLPSFFGSPFACRLASRIPRVSFDETLIATLAGYCQPRGWSFPLSLSSLLLSLSPSLSSSSPVSRVLNRLTARVGTVGLIARTRARALPISSDNFKGEWRDSAVVLFAVPYSALPPPPFPPLRLPACGEGSIRSPSNASRNKAA